MLPPLPARRSGVTMPQIGPDVFPQHLFVDPPALFPICYLFLLAAAFPTNVERKEAGRNNK
jgi:hypothetical protein